MDTHVKVVGWLWIANGLLSILMAVIGLAVINWPGVIPGEQDSLLASIGAVCCFLPGIIAYVLAGYGLLKYKSWARILAIILAILNLILFPIGTAIGIYTLWAMFNDETKALFAAGS
jgi:fructose-specific phosphotransferase system IIC component